MGGDPSQIHVIWLVPDVPIDSFDALHAECDNEADRDRLLITVEAAAGGIHGFNTYVRNVISSAKKTTVEALSLAESSLRSDMRATMHPTSLAAGMSVAHKWLPGRITPKLGRKHMLPACAAPVEQHELLIDSMEDGGENVGAAAGASSSSMKPVEACGAPRIRQ